jgi:hypothetical protein
LEYLLLAVAKLLGNAVAFVAFDSGLAVRDNFAILDIVSLDLLERRADELRDNGEFLAGVDSLSFAVETLVSLTIGVEVTAIGVADTGVSS